MKYICTKDEEGLEEIFLFPRNINHDDMAEVLSHIKTETPSGGWNRMYREPISAGFINSANCCVGRSETLGVESRLKEDTDILTTQLSQRLVF